MTDWQRRKLAAAAAQPYRRNGRFAYHFALGKLTHDPIFWGLLESNLFDRPWRILDLGCGQGLFANWLDAACDLQSADAAMLGLPTSSRFASYHGIELMPADVRRADGALPPAARIHCDDIRVADFDQVDRVLILDVLHYLSYDEQEKVIDRVRQALDDEGVLLLRVSDKDAGWRFKVTLLTDHLITFIRGHRTARLYCRRLQEWTDLLHRHGFRVDPIPMSTGTPFANILLVARV